MENKKRVLVVDDEPGILSFVRINLTVAGYDVLTAGGGKEALELAQSRSPDIMILDILMHPMTGFDVLAKLRTFSQMPVIVFTAHREIADQALQKGASGYVSKPFLPDELVRKIRGVLDNRDTGMTSQAIS